MDYVIWPMVFVALVASLSARRTSLFFRFGLELVALAILSALLFPLVGSPLHPNFLHEPGSAETSERVFVGIWWLLAARVLLLGGRIGYDNQENASRLFFDLISGVIHLGVIITILNLVFGVSVTSLVATSGIIAIVLGLALQSTLGDLFSGIAISIEKPFGIGDYIWLEGAMEGTVIETNWRATRIVTDTHDIATVPNSVVAKSRILNRSRPTEIRNDNVRIVLDPAVPPHRGVEILEAALLSTSGLAPESPGQVLCIELRGEGTAYQVFFSAPRRKLGVARSNLLHNIATHTRFAGAAMAMQNNVPLNPLASPDGYQLLCETDLFASLGDAERQTLASALIPRRGDKGEFLFEQGSTKASLFFISEGVFDVTLDSGQGPKLLGTIAPGEHVGELSLLTGIESPASIQAATPFLAYELKKESLATLIENNPDILDKIEAGAKSSKDRLASLSGQVAANVGETTPNLIDRIRSFFDLPF